jgi:putative flavoprotein involved in K+ transport
MFDATATARVNAAATPRFRAEETDAENQPGGLGRHPRRGGQVVVVGGGPAGLAAWAELRRAGVGAVVLEQADTIGAPWRGRYDRLRLNTSRVTARLRGARYERGTGLFPSRDGFIAYLEQYVQRQGIDVRLGTRVQRIDRGDGAWALRTSAGDMRADQVIVATGYAHEPFVPAWSGRDRFTGRLVHSAEYRNADPFRNRDVLVVGPGSSGMEIAYDLAEGGAGRVRLSVRTVPNVVLRSLGGLPGDLFAVAMLRLPPPVADAQGRVLRRLVLGDLSDVGLPQPQEGPFARLRRVGVAPAVVDKEVIQAIKERRIEVVGGVDALDATGVKLSDRARIEPDAIIAATGYRCGLESLVGHLAVLDERGAPRAVGGREAAPGLRFTGFVPVPGQIRYLGVEAKRAARAIARQTRHSRKARPDGAQQAVK